MSAYQKFLKMAQIKAEREKMAEENAPEQSGA